MPTLLEKPSSTPAPLPAQVLQSRHRWERWRGVLIALLVGLFLILAGLLILHPSWHVPDNAKTLATVWLSGLLLTAVAVFIAWKSAPHSLANTAQNIDRDLATKNRLEAMAALHESASPLAKAQRDETADYLRQQPAARPVRALPWLIGGVIGLVGIHFILMGVWVVPSLLKPPAPKPPPPLPEMPHASIVWKSPEPESKANPVEEVPTVAVAQSSSGLRNITLEIFVNGTQKKSQPLPAEPYDKPGKNTLKVSLYMDELGVEPYDIVSYYLRGQRITDQKVPDTVSTIQFIQVRPFRDDVGINKMPGDPGENKILTLIRELELAQLKSMKENFIIAHTDLAVTDPVRAKENDRVGKNQGDLSKKTEEAVQYFIQEDVDAKVIDLLRQAEPLMDDASKKILATQNVEALAPQGKAFDLIVQIGKLFHKVMDLKTKTGPSKPPPSDPFQDKQQHELKQRSETIAGELEQLAKNQASLAKDLNEGPSTPGSTPSTADKPDSQPKSTAQATPGSQGNPAPGSDSSAPTGTNPDAADKSMPTPQAVDPFTPDANKGTFAERQARVLQGIETLRNTNAPLPAPVSQALEDAQKHATESVHQLDQGNNSDAREPAASAAQDLQHAIAALNEAGEKETTQAMADAQRDLNAAAQQLKDLAKNAPPGSQSPGLSDVAAKVQDIQKKAEDAADKQQEDGSAKGAQRLTDLANQIGSQRITKDLGAIAQKGMDVNQAALIAQRMEALANQAAHGMTGDKPSAQEIAQLVNALEASRANLARLAEKAGLQPNASNHLGQTPGQQPGKDPGSDQTPGQGQQPGQNQGQGQGQGKGDQPGQGQGQGDQPGGNAPGSSTSGGDAPGGKGVGGNGGITDLENKAFNETVADMQNQAQQASTILPTSSGSEIQQKLSELPKAYQTVRPVDVVHTYQILAPPLEKLIQDLTVLAEQAQRQDIIKQPDLDDAPPSYRPAVSNYFENMSKDYHPDDADKDTKKP